MDAVILNILKSLKIEQITLNETTACNYTGIKCSFINKTDCFFNELIPYFESNKSNVDFFILVKKSYEHYINSNIADMSYRINKSKNGEIYYNGLISYFKYRHLKEVPLSRQYFSCMVTNLNNFTGTRNSYKIFRESYEKRVIDYESELKGCKEINEIDSLIDYICKQYLNEELSILRFEYLPISQQDFIHYFGPYKMFDFIFKLNSYFLEKENSLHYTTLNEEIIKVYNEHKINLEAVDKQFSKYRLIQIDNHMNVLSTKDSTYLTDSRIENYNFNISIEKSLLDYIEKLFNEGLIGERSYRVTSLSTVQASMEDIERGGTLELDIKNMPHLSLFYNECYENKLSIIHDPSEGEIIFEELCEDFYMVEDSVITQVVHLIYSEVGDEYFINHIDHELIVYALDEYDEKIKNQKVKGSKGKVKSFKIDNAKIPFFYNDNNEYFLYKVLDSYFLHKDLLKEYFGRIIS
ncbi:hypothetical protein PSR30_12310 [Pectobacterium carotovorum subsp. carotovorum]|uniref:hypothetical protein n=1 Tax=Pectobacterium TaxID=122277 RepID=UPI00057D4C12|nr:MULTISPECIES: hypothetical protein [Pectobacterium]KHS89420.1 hypothetical protein RC83_05895 [Pectobacterium brasiliense]KHT39671.1 hypothetical protein RD02_15740 [Pectobacterium brasiliense]MDC9818186.1 hypothetical protein [Pectobacterium polonicum]POE23014.1 hypothetical protein BV923_07135 [Pectobacterium odoriferum]WDF97221.1 hypothetical protein PSR30_12310 [Pectobacterium carotovorum subsp. carotovorum]